MQHWLRGGWAPLHTCYHHRHRRRRRHQRHSQRHLHYNETEHGCDW